MNDPTGRASARALTSALRSSPKWKADVRMLIAELRRVAQRRRLAAIDFDDPTNIGIPNTVFLVGWDGVRLNPPMICHEDSKLTSHWSLRS